MTKKVYMLLFAFMAAFALQAQNANDILDKAVQKFKSYKSVKSQYYVTFTGSDNYQKVKGAIIFQGNKYVNAYSDNVIWYNGKTMWTLVRANQEVTVINPTQKELASNNPYYFINNYKNAFKTELVRQNTKSWTIKMIPNDKTDNMKSVLIDIDKDEFRPTSVKVDYKEGCIDIQVNTFVTNRPYKSSSFSFDRKDYPDVEVIDLR